MDMIDRIVAQLKKTDTTLEIASYLGLHPHPDTPEAAERRERMVVFFVDVISAARMTISDRTPKKPTMASDRYIQAAFFYLLLRDHLPAGTVEKLVAEAEAVGMPVTFSNKPLSQYAYECADRLYGRERP